MASEGYNSFYMTAVIIRPARPEEAETLSEIAIRSKAHWGYGEAFMEACRNDLRVQENDFAAGNVVKVAEAALQVVGFYYIHPGSQPGEYVLESLFIEPSFIGQGLGRSLFLDAVSEAKKKGANVVMIESDPNAVGFYTAMGAVLVGEVESSIIPGRKLPLLEFRLV